MYMLRHRFALLFGLTVGSLTLAACSDATAPNPDPEPRLSETQGSNNKVGRIHTAAETQGANN
jgi:hypothetical protein